MSSTKYGHVEESLFVGGHPGDDSGTDWREILAPSPFGPTYIGQALKEDAAEIARRWNAHPAMLAALEEAERMLAIMADPADASSMAVLALARAALTLARGA